jgi:hypothetical protein
MAEQKRDHRRFYAQCPNHPLHFILADDPDEGPRLAAPGPGQRACPGCGSHDHPVVVSVTEWKQGYVSLAERDRLVTFSEPEAKAPRDNLIMAETLDVTTCFCTEKFCGHKNELRCGKPLSPQATAELQRENQDFSPGSLGICDECWANIKKHRAISA